jgi:hypothetical protein
MAFTFRMVSGFEFSGPLAQVKTPPFRFLFAGPQICLQVPSDSISRWTPLAVRLTIPTIRACRGLTRPTPSPIPQVSEVATTATSVALTRYAPCLAHHKKRCPEIPEHRFFLTRARSFRNSLESEGLFCEWYLGNNEVGTNRPRLKLCSYSAKWKVYALPVEPLAVELLRPGERNPYSPGVVTLVRVTK